MQVDLAIKILDGSYFRAGEAAPISVQKAKFELHGEFQAKKRGNARKRKKTAQIVEDKALGWGGFDDKIKDTEVRCQAAECKLFHTWQSSSLCTRVLSCGMDRAYAPDVCRLLTCIACVAIAGQACCGQHL